VSSPPPNMHGGGEWRVGSEERMAGAGAGAGAGGGNLILICQLVCRMGRICVGRENKKSPYCRTRGQAEVHQCFREYEPLL
jgi:hypothetical protein